jgi:hypothetical protein
MQNLLNETPIDIKVQNEIIGNLFSRKSTLRLQPDDLDWTPFFKYYSQQCNQALRERGKHVLARTHQDIIDIVHHLESQLSKEEIKEILQPRLKTPKALEEEDAILEGTIDLATRILLMMDIGLLHNAFSGRSPLVWEDKSLKDFVHEYFTERPAHHDETVSLEPIFTGRNLCRIAGIEIEWTDNLADHLRMVGGRDDRVAIFHHASFLQWQQR